MQCNLITLLFDKELILIASLDGRWTIDIGQLRKEVHGVLVLAALGLTDPAEDGGEEEEEVHEQSHPDNLPSPSDLM